MTPDLRAAQVAALNDEFRLLGPLFGYSKFEGLWLLSHGVLARGPVFTWQSITEVQNFDAGSDGGERSSGSLEIEGVWICWEFDYLARGTPEPAEDPADNEDPCRILTITLASEF